MATQIAQICRCCELSAQLDHLLARPDRTETVAQRLLLTMELETALDALEQGLQACDNGELARRRGDVI